jgi:hypothetical protein
MKANELRIGNYGLNPIDNNNIVQLVAIYPDETTQWEWDGYDGFTSTSIAMKPIPLTEDWLKRFAQKQYSYTTFYIEKVGWLELNGDVWNVDFVDGYTIAQIKYVHQLQNLYFALTGEELKIIQK